MFVAFFFGLGRFRRDPSAPKVFQQSFCFKAPSHETVEHTVESTAGLSNFPYSKCRKTGRMHSLLGHGCMMTRDSEDRANMLGVRTPKPQMNQKCRAMLNAKAPAVDFWGYSGKQLGS